jgi:hypothetical protein
MTQRSRSLLVLALAVVLSSCGLVLDPGEPAEEAIVGGTLASSHPEAVVVDGIGSGTRCTGVLLGPRLVLTAGRCVTATSPQGFTVTAPFAPPGARRTARAYEWATHLPYGINEVDAEHPDVAVLHLDAPIEAGAFAELPPTGTASGTLRIFGRALDGALTDEVHESPDVVIETGDAAGLPLHYLASPQLIQTGDLGGPAIESGTHVVRGVVSGVVFVGTTPFDALSRIDLPDVRAWLADLALRCGTSQCRLPIVGYVDAGPVDFVACPAGTTHAELFFGLDYCHPGGLGGIRQNLAGTCPAPPGERWIHAGRPGPDRCMRPVTIDADWRTAACPAGTRRVTRIAFGEQAADGCETATSTELLSLASTDCAGRVVARLGDDVCIECGPGMAWTGAECAPRPLVMRDVTNVARSGTMTSTEYFLSILPGTTTDRVYVHLVGWNDATQHTYPGAEREGHLLLAHTFDTDSPEPMTARVDYVDASGAARTLDVLLPAFETSGGRKMMLWVAQDGSTFYADPEHDGVSQLSEVLAAEVAISPQHLAASRQEVTALRAIAPIAPTRVPDRIGMGDGMVDPDGFADSVLELDVTGAVRDVRLALEDDGGNVVDGIQWDTFGGGRMIPTEIGAGFLFGDETWVLGVERGGGLLNTPDGEVGALRPQLGAGPHTLRLYAPTAELYGLARFRVDVVFADGTIGALTAPRFDVRDECATTAHVCSWAGECSDLLAGYACRCAPGFTGDGTSCRSAACPIGEAPRPDGTCAPALRFVSATWGGSCGAPTDVLAHVRARCENQRSCSYLVDPAALGDPAPACAEDYVVRWRCAFSGPIFESRVASPAAGASIPMTCE